MSATGRNKTGSERDALDRYDTPPWCVEILLEDDEIRSRMALLANEAARSKGRIRWVDPCVGAGNIVRTCQQIWAPDYWSLADLEPRGPFGRFGRSPTDYDYDLVVGDGIDFLREGPPAGICWNLCITNFPYSLTDAFARAAVQSCSVVAVLLRVSWAGAEGDASRLPRIEDDNAPSRNEWLRANPCDLHMLPHRPSFDGKGSDSAAYAWYTWYGAARGRFRILPCIPRSQRKRG